MCFRYIAVHYPLNYNQAMNDKNALKQRMIKYMLPVVMLSILININKFVEATYAEGDNQFKGELNWEFFSLNLSNF